MFFRFLTALFLLSFIAISALAQTSGSQSDQSLATQEVDDSTPSEYRLGVGDIVRVQVFGEPDLSMSVQLTELGVFTYPYLGELKVVGMTVSSVQKMITDVLAGDILVDPKVSVAVESYRQIFVGGEVGRSGSFPYQPGLTVGKAIFLAGGFTERSSKKRVKVQSEGEEKSKRVGLDYLLKPGDIVTVSRRFF